MMDAMCKEPGCGWRHGRQRTECLTQCIKSQNVAGGRGNRGQYSGRIVCSGLLKEGECRACVRACVGVVRWLYSSHYSMVGVVRCGNQCNQ